MPFEQVPPSLQPERRSKLLPNVRLEGTEDVTHQESFDQDYDERFLNQDMPWIRDIRKYEKRPTPEEIETMKLIDTWTNALLKRYGAPPTKIPPSAIHILDKDHLPIEWEEDGEGVSYGPLGTFLVRQTHQYPLAHIGFHELLHTKSRISYKIGRGPNGEYLQKRSGIRLNRYSSKEAKITTDHFRWMNEAVTEELTKTFIQTCFKAGMWKAERDQTVATLLEPDIPSDVKKNLSDVFFARPLPQKPKGWFKKPPKESGPKYEIRECSYPSERAMLKLLIDTLYERNPSQFQSHNQVFDVFARAMLRDTLLPLGRLIERTFGRGSFKKIGATKDIEELQTIIQQSDSK